ncbi:MAG TPA: nucleotidyltransferase domain-containing protein [Gammaproteobacteria bacterium]|nr:nucleotidyltransferase domain-containing protein [Gammaproteobacteria bacterium]
MNNAIDICASDLKIVQNILRNTLAKNAKVWVFGSRVKGTVRRASDLDIAIDVERKLKNKEKSELFHAFEESDLPYKVDIVDLQNVDEGFKKIIDQQKVILNFE